MPMGCYGIGITRIVAAAIEQNNDERGIIWPAGLAPFEVIITPIGYHKSEAVKQASDELYESLMESDVEVLLDDRNERPGIMFADADLLGIPHRVTIGDRSLKEDSVEYKTRQSDQAETIGKEKIFDFLTSRLS